MKTPKQKQKHWFSVKLTKIEKDNIEKIINAEQEKMLKNTGYKLKKRVVYMKAFKLFAQKIGLELIWEI